MEYPKLFRSPVNLPHPVSFPSSLFSLSNISSALSMLPSSIVPIRLENPVSIPLIISSLPLSSARLLPIDPISVGASRDIIPIIAVIAMPSNAMPLRPAPMGIALRMEIAPAIARMVTAKPVLNAEMVSHFTFRISLIAILSAKAIAPRPTASATAAPIFAGFIGITFRIAIKAIICSSIPPSPAMARPY